MAFWDCIFVALYVITFHWCFCTFQRLGHLFPHLLRIFFTSWLILIRSTVADMMWQHEIKRCLLVGVFCVRPCALLRLRNEEGIYESIVELCYWDGRLRGPPASLVAAEQMSNQRSRSSRFLLRALLFVLFPVPQTESVRFLCPDPGFRHAIPLCWHLNNSKLPVDNILFSSSFVFLVVLWFCCVSSCSTGLS